MTAYKYSQTLENVTYIEIKKNGKEGGTTVLPGGFVIWTENSHCPFIDKVDINSPLFTMNKIKHSNSEDYVLKILKAGWKITPEVFKQYYPDMDRRISSQMLKLELPYSFHPDRDNSNSAVYRPLLR